MLTLYGSITRKFHLNSFLASGDMKKSSANPVEIKTLDKVHVLACGMGIAHSIFIARNESEADEKAISTYGILDQSDLD